MTKYQQGKQLILESIRETIVDSLRSLISSFITVTAITVNVTSDYDDEGYDRISAQLKDVDFIVDGDDDDIYNEIDERVWQWAREQDSDDDKLWSAIDGWSDNYRIVNPLHER